MADHVTFPKCPRCGSTNRHCWLLAGKEHHPRNRWHRERLVFDYRRVRCPECGAGPGYQCASDNDHLQHNEHAARRAAFRLQILNNPKFAALPF